MVKFSAKILGEAVPNHQNRPRFVSDNNTSTKQIKMIQLQITPKSCSVHEFDKEFREKIASTPRNTWKWKKGNKGRIIENINYEGTATIGLLKTDLLEEKCYTMNIESKKESVFLGAIIDYLVRHLKRHIKRVTICSVRKPPTRRPPPPLSRKRGEGD